MGDSNSTLPSGVDNHPSGTVQQTYVGNQELRMANPSGNRMNASDQFHLLGEGNRTTALNQPTYYSQGGYSLAQQHQSTGYYTSEAQNFQTGLGMSQGSHQQGNRATFLASAQQSQGQVWQPDQQFHQGCSAQSTVPQPVHPVNVRPTGAQQQQSHFQNTNPQFQNNFPTNAGIGKQGSDGVNANVDVTDRNVGSTQSKMHGEMNVTGAGNLAERSYSNELNNPNCSVFKPPINISEKILCYYTKEDMETVEKSYSEMIHQFAEQHNKELQAKEEELAKVRQSLLEKSKDTEEMSKRLAAEMNNKVASNESSIENISIRNRPMKIAEQYGNICSNSWLHAKELLDQNFPENTSDSSKYKFLLGILEISYEEALQMCTNLQHTFTSVLNNPLGAKSVDRRSKDTDNAQHPSVNVDFKRSNTAATVRVKSVKSGNRRSVLDNPALEKTTLSVPLLIAIGDHLRSSADEADLTPLQKVVQQKTGDRMKHHTSMVQHGPLCDYISDSVRLAWKMVNQRPPMEFKCPKKKKVPTATLR